MVYLTARVLHSACAMIPSCSDHDPNGPKSLCFSVIPGSVMLTHTILEGFITEWQSHTYYIECLKRELITKVYRLRPSNKITAEGLEDK